MCGETHDGLTTDWAYELPDIVWQISEAERAERAKFNDDLCRLGERHFIRCILEVPISSRADRFGWGVWAEVEETTFHRYLELFNEDASAEQPYPGVIANDVAAYEESLGLPVMLQFRDATTRPSLHFAEANTSRIALEQRNGMDDVRYHEILDILGAR